MLFMGHLMIGLAIGFVLYAFIHDRWIIFFCAFGSVLPDLFVKSLGNTFLISNLKYGNFFFHGLIIILLFFFFGLIIWRYYQSVSFLVLGFGVLIHQVVDKMWKQPTIWYYPFLGQYVTKPPSDFFLQVISTEFSSETEWIFFIVIIIVALVLYHYRYY
jgi:hypothetical protein